LRVLLVEPDHRKNTSLLRKYGKKDGTTPLKRNYDEVLWYPPLGLLKLATFHKRRGDEVKFLNGCDKSLFKEPDLFSPAILWDRVYISTLFTFQWRKTIETINFYKEAVGGSIHKIFVGGIMASIMPEEIFQETGISPILGVINSPRQIGLEGNENIDVLPPDYDILDNSLYAINDTYYAYTTRGCTNRCQYCGVPVIEPSYIEYIDIKEMIKELRSKYGDKPRLKLMDNNILASQRLEQIVMDLLALGYGKNQFTDTNPKKQRVVDFNQGLDASYINQITMSLLSALNIRPMRVAFDNIKEKEIYITAVETARQHGVKEFSNYMLYNWRDAPKDLYERLLINIRLNKKWGRGTKRSSAAIYSYPMRYAPIRSRNPMESNRSRDYIPGRIHEKHDFIGSAVWTKRFTRNVEIMKGAASGAISPTPALARRTIGKTYKEFIANLYMPEELLRNRNKHEKKVYRHEPKRPPGTGKVEEFRKFILDLLKTRSQEAMDFHNAVSQNTTESIKEYHSRCINNEVNKWLKFYIKRG
jgi:hypothetical protein